MPVATREGVTDRSLMTRMRTVSLNTSQFQTETLVGAPGPSERTFRLASGDVIDVPPDWELLPPGDAGLTRRVKAAGPTWTMKEKKGRREFSRGIWADSNQMATAKAQVDAKRRTPQYAKAQASAKKRRDEKQDAYVEDFLGAVIQFLDFHAAHHAVAQRVADAVTQHATPVGSGTVARTQRIPIERRAEAAVIAWMRHQTTAYDDMKIEHVQGRRREVRRELASKSRQILQKYRRGDAKAMVGCPLAKALRSPTPNAKTA